MGEPVVIAVSDGVWGLQVIRRELPEHLSTEQHQGRVAPCDCTPLLSALRVTRQSRVRVQGFRRECGVDEHAGEHWLSGTYQGRDLVLKVCRFCWRVEVRDVSFDELIDTASDGRTKSLTPVGMAPLRKNDLLGLYSGTRPLGRVYL